MKKIVIILCAVICCVACNEHKVDEIKFYGSTARVMNIGDRDTLEAVIYPVSSHIYNTIFWLSSDPNVASVDARGIVTAVYSGTCTITATAGDKTATCEIRVNTFGFKIEFTKAVAYFFGNESGIEGVNTAVLQLYSDGFHIENDGNVSGFGSYFSTEINYPAPNLLPPNGSYKDSVIPANFKFIQGEWVTETSVAGTYFVSTGLDGTGVILIDKGTLKISDGSITGNFTGSSDEKIEINYLGNVQLVDLTLPPPDTLQLDNFVQNYSLISNPFDNGTNIKRCRIYTENGTGPYLRLDFVVPISAGAIPVGFYKLNNSHQPYTLVESNLVNGTGTMWYENSATPKEVLYGNADVKKVDDKLKLTIHLVETSGRVIVGEVMLSYQ